MFTDYTSNFSIVNMIFFLICVLKNIIKFFVLQYTISTLNLSIYNHITKPHYTKLKVLRGIEDGPGFVVSMVLITSSGFLMKFLYDT